MAESNREAVGGDERALVAAVKKDGPERDAAWRTLHRLYANRLAVSVYPIVKSKEAAEDVVQQTMVKAMNNIAHFREGSSFYTWMYRIAQNLAIDAFRKRGRHREFGIEEIEGAESEDPRADHLLEAEDNAEWVQRALAMLTPEHQEALKLREMEDNSYAEIARKMGIPEGTALSRVFYARKAMQEALKETRGWRRGEGEKERPEALSPEPIDTLAQARAKVAEELPRYQRDVDDAEERARQARADLKKLTE